MAQLAIGTMVGNYRITEELGDGGAGAVFRAVDELTSRDVAVRRLRRELAGDSHLVDSLAGISAQLGRLNDSQISTPLGVFRFDADVLVMTEFVTGEPLGHLLTRVGRIPWRVAVDYVSQTLRALEHAHAAGVVHGGIRPSNLVLGEHGRMKVVDFGVARVAVTQALAGGERIGPRLTHFSPEQLRGEPGDLRSDLYAVASVLFELVAGRSPYPFSDFSSFLLEVTSGPAPSLRTIVPGVPEWIEDVVLRASAKTPADRYQSAAEAREAIESGLHNVTQGAARDPRAPVTVVAPSGPARTGNAPTQAPPATVTPVEPVPGAPPLATAPGTSPFSDETILVIPSAAPQTRAPRIDRAADPDRTVLVSPADLPPIPVVEPARAAASPGLPQAPASQAAERHDRAKRLTWVHMVWIAVALAILVVGALVVLVRLGVLPGPRRPESIVPSAAASAADPMASPQEPAPSPPAAEIPPSGIPAPTPAAAPAAPPVTSTVGTSAPSNTAPVRQAAPLLASRPASDPGVPPPDSAASRPAAREAPPALPDRSFARLKFLTQIDKQAKELDAGTWSFAPATWF